MIKSVKPESHHDGAARGNMISQQTSAPCWFTNVELNVTKHSSLRENRDIKNKREDISFHKQDIINQ